MLIARLFSFFKRKMAPLSAATSNPCEFSDNRDGGISVWVSPAAIDVMWHNAVKSRRYETGGILIGSYGADGLDIDVVEATPKPKGSLSGWLWFQRGKTGLSELLEDRWRLGLHYLGEWHYHPSAAPTPSGPDIEAMQKIAGDDAYRCRNPLLIILGGSPRKNWSLSATLIRDGFAVRLNPKD
ncbi:Mov34/MPN/PAD-1 family protein [Acuticoccus sediminis]|uniref:Mov34/MPN/PAD-1 family protein n=1 Tax=Acuticoccus sediminis TaxID=2184697 RepID=UPI001CFCFE5F|nr:Mov34/MPN/PAD-1 family protein [Acuticoccus sediminis]